MNNAFSYFRAKQHKRIVAALAAWSLLGAMPFSAFGLPQGGRSRSGNVSWQSSGGTMTVNQLSNRAIINWDSFSIGDAETVQFMQPGINAAILNRVTGPYSSEIFGSLLANGHVYLINPNGILFGAGSRINVGGLVASTLDISDDDFNAGQLNFMGQGNSDKKVTNHGRITASSFAYLLGAGAENHGSITAPAVALAAGRDRIVIDRTASGGEIRLSVDADMPAISLTAFDGPQNMPSVINSGVIDASGARGGDVALQGVNVVQAGAVRADGIEGDGGRISLRGERLVALGSDSVTTANAGLDGNGGRVDLISENFLGVYERAYIAARGGSRSGNGGFVETSGHQSFVLDAAPDVGAAYGRGGEWLIDPRNITIVDSLDVGWMWNGNDMMAIWDNARIKVLDIQTGLASGDVTIRTGSTGTQDGDITVNADITFTAYPGTTLTLDAARDIALNANITAGAGNTFGLTAGGDVTQAAGKVIQLGAVAFDVDGNVTLNSANNRIGALSGTVGGDLSVVNDRTLDLNGLRVADGTATLNVNGNLTDTGANTIADLTVRTTGDITLDAANDLGRVTANANGGTGAITLRDAAGALNDNGIILRDIDGGTLSVVAVNGSITQEDGTRVMIGGASDLTAADQITLFNPDNDFGGPVSARAAGVQLRDVNAIALGTVNAGADGLVVQADGGTITQVAAGRVTVEGETRLTARDAGAAPADILLDNAGNNFIGAVHADGATIALADMNDILLGRIDAAGEFDVAAWGGNISQTADGVSVQGKATLYAAGDITLGNAINDFIDGPVHANARNITLTDRNSILLGGVRARGTLGVTALDGDITQTDLAADGIIAQGEATFTAEGNAVVLGSAHNDFKDTVNAYGRNITLTDGADGISIGRVKGLANPGDGTAADTVVITALNGGITDAQGETVGHDAEGFATQDAPRTVNIAAQNLLLLADGDIGAAGTPLDIAAGTLAARATDGNIWLYESDALTLGTVNGVSGITAAGHVKVETLDGTLTVDRRVEAGRDVLLAANGAGSDVVLNRRVTAGGNLTVLAAQDVRQHSRLTAAQSVDVEAKAGAVIMDGRAAVSGGDVVYRSAQDLAVTRIRGANVRIEAGGDITDANLNYAPNIIADTAQLVAGGSVGGAGGTESDDNRQALDTIVGTLAVNAGESVYVRNMGGALTLGDVDAINVNRVALDSTTTALGGAALSGAAAGQNLKIVNTRGDLTVAAAVTAQNGDLLLFAQDGALNIGADVTAGDLLTLRGNGITLDANLAAGGDLALDGGGGDIVFNTGAALDAENIHLTADGDVAVDHIAARDAVSIVAGGNITDANADETANITARRVRLEAGGAIGAAGNTESDTNVNALDLVADNVEAVAGGNIYLQADGAMTIGGVGDLDFASARFDSGTSVVRHDNLDGISAGGVAKIKAGALTVAEGVSAGNDLLLLTTAGDLTLNAAAAAGGNATLAAAGALRQNADITAGGDIALSGASIIATSGRIHGGNVRYASAGDVVVDTIVADGLVNIVAAGHIRDANHDTAPNITADRIRLDAGRSIGTADDALDIEARTVAVNAFNSVHLRSDGDILIGAVEAVETRTARFDSGTTTVVDPALAGLTANGAVSLVSGNGNIRQTPDGIVSIGGPTEMEALNGDIALENPGNDFRGRVDATARNVLLRDLSDLWVGHIHATQGGRVRLTAGGSILDDGSAVNVTAGTAEFYAGRNIGSPLYLNVGTILNARAGGSINMTQVAGNMRILGQVYAGGNVRLDVWNGGIVDADGDGYVPQRFITPGNADIYSGGSMSLTADFVGTLHEPLELISRRSLSLSSHRPYAPPNGAYPWVVINGYAGHGAQDIFVNKNGVPGLVIFNGQIVWGPWWTVRRFQLAQRSLADRNQPNLLDSGIVNLPWFLQPDMSLLSPSAVRDDLREAEQKTITGAEEDVPEGEPRTKVIGLPVTSLNKNRE